MQHRIKVKAAEGRRVRDPKTLQVIPEQGIEVSGHDPFWLRRLRDGDVVEVAEDGGQTTDDGGRTTDAAATPEERRRLPSSVVRRPSAE